MKGYRVIGSRKRKLIEGPLSKALALLEKRGVNGFVYLSKKYDVRTMEGFKNIKTKQISGMISDLRELL